MRGLAWILGAALCVPCAQATEERPVINWMVAHWPPAMILKDGRAPQSAADLGDGVVDRMLAELVRRLPHYEHRFQLSTTRRTWHSMALGEPLCQASAFASLERERLAYFTPSVLMPPVALVVRRELAAQLSPQGAPVDLQQLMERTDLQGRLESARSYGTQLDTLVGQQIAREPVSNIGQMAQLVSKGRVDYTLEYAVTVEYWRRQGQLSQPLVALPLRVGGDWVVAQVACTRSPWGREVIAAVDGAVRAAAATRSYRDLVFSWQLGPVSEADRQRVDQFFNERMQHVQVK
ncbi:TIGR02285 family protein [Pelomonas sp. V22]|uniref:TIGR02285 family protein n=1 Tax=Pelomonas sp. V22 TaxID=2822139 RepID=UPI0024A7EB0E|nr:TIGR02285 family protein [Pelomonas sp. V22]MDI4634398.1 TIGR02285 family protein [Pelomonas sp. V22]